MLSDVSRDFAPATRAKGERYYRTGRVSPLTTDAKRVTAMVAGTSDYPVSIVFDEPSLVGACSCPHFFDGHACKHLWATLLATDAVGALPAWQHARFELDLDAANGIDDAWLEALDELPGMAEVRRLGGFGTRGRPPWPGVVARPKPPPPRWIDHLRAVRPPDLAPAAPPPRPRPQRVLYCVDVDESLTAGGLTLQVRSCDRKANGDWGKVKNAGTGVATEAEDQRLLALLGGCAGYQYSGYGYAAAGYPQGRGGGTPFAVGSQFRLPAALLETLVPALSATGRFHLVRSGGEMGPPLAWDAGPAWELALEAEPEPDGQSLRISGFLRRGDLRRPLAEPALLLAGGVVIDGDRIGRLHDFGRFDWIAALRRHGSLAVPVSELDGLLGETLLRSPDLPLRLPDAMQWDIVNGVPAPRLTVRSPGPYDYPRDKLRGTVDFDYGAGTVSWHDAQRGIADREGRRVVLRDPDAEGAALAALAAAGARRSAYPPTTGAAPDFEIPPARLPAIARALAAQGWKVEADGRAIRPSTRVDVRVRSGIDWFEVEGDVVFGDVTVPLPQVLKALAHGADSVLLGDGTSGLLPEEWLRRHGFALSFGEADGSALRFRRSQLGLLDELLEAVPAASVDETVARARAELRAFDGVAPADPADGFVGALRPYQRDGLGWLRFLERFGFGGCLADDMGLGKTVQVLAHLHARRAAGEASGPSLVVAPRSVIFNWMAEAARFVPGLRVLDHSGTMRDAAHIDGHDLVLTTYGTLRRDAAHLKDVAFDYVVLDEAHAIKNAASATAKAARVLRARHRIALSGTPVQNHLGELWSLFEFLNPGMLGSVRLVTGLSKGQVGDPAQLDSLRRALRPFVLRRTKEAVARDLPARVEQTLYCELGAAQRALYEQLRRHYQVSVRERIARQGLARSRLHVLEALLRLRQVACHPALVERKRDDAESAKLEVLLARLEEVVEDGHKALVFSQFTSLLALVRRELDARGVGYAYLDGRTRDRASKVAAFQQRDDLPLFLISLKAGGLGLNLTAADYVFLLDPWWNPAIEAQAIDRAHRIGQTRQVMACRLIARDTIEEKILELQARKRGLADAIISADAGLLRQLTAEDLDLLLG